MAILDKSSTEYLRSDIEFNQLFSENTGLLEVIPPLVKVDAEAIGLPRFHTSGNGIVYLAGGILVQNAISPNDPIAILPTRLIPKFSQQFGVVVDNPSPGNFSATGIGVTKEGTVISLNSINVVLNPLLSFDGIAYLLG